jgi:hypothetical protein
MTWIEGMHAKTTMHTWVCLTTKGEEHASSKLGLESHKGIKVD